jgi:hypothetical protein
MDMAISKLFIQLVSTFLCCVFLGVSSLGIFVCVKIPAYAYLGSLTIIFGGLGALISLFGFCGAGFEKSKKDDKKVKVS